MDNHCDVSPNYANERIYSEIQLKNETWNP